MGKRKLTVEVGKYTRPVHVRQLDTNAVGRFGICVACPTCGRPVAVLVVPVEDLCKFPVIHPELFLGHEDCDLFRLCQLLEMEARKKQ
jgi:hypothetical protein